MKLHPIEAPILQPGCPWSDFNAGTIRFCEEPICAWITQPSNTWSNLAYLFVGLYLITKTKTLPDAHPLKWFGPSSIFVFIGSSLFHASSTFFGEFLDLSSMFVFSGLLLTLNLVRTGFTSLAKAFWVFLMFVGSSMLVLSQVNAIGIGIFIAHIAITVFLELRLYLRSKKNSVPINYRYFWYAGAFIIAAQIAWQLDLHRIVCDPHDHIFQLHAVWHILNSLCFAMLWKFYRQFKELEPIH